jgi:hypothetical protein
MFSPEDAEAVRALVAKGSLGGGVFETADSQKTSEELSAKGVTFLPEPAEWPYGIEALFRDDSGNGFSLTQPKWLGQSTPLQVPQRGPSRVRAVERACSVA